MIFRQLSYLVSYCFCFLYIFAQSSAAGVNGYSNETDMQALLSIKYLLKDPSAALSSWNQSLQHCSWRGVTCSSSQRVIALNLSSLNLFGSLSPSIGNLTFLQDVDLQSNNFVSALPQEIGRLFRLKYLRLANNTFQGNIPTNLTRCSALLVLDLSQNNLEGEIPDAFGSLSKLNQLSFLKNNLTGIIPPSLGNLSSLHLLDLSRNGLDGSIPDSFVHLSNLQVLSCSSNTFSGEVPAQLYNISSLQILSLSNNLLTGFLPATLGLTLPSLTLFSTSQNEFYGSIPPSFANASGLVRLGLDRNNFTGLIPLNFGHLQELQVFDIGGNPFDKSNDISFLSTLTNCTNLQTLSLFDIQVGGVLPDSFANFSTMLTSVWLDENYITGSIPVAIGNLVGLSYLTLDTNLLSGSIPESIGKLTQLQELYLFTNNISGHIPSSIGNITGLIIVILEDNILEGSIPASLGNCSDLTGLHLAQNHLSGTIPEEIFSLSSLSIGLVLAQNYLTGSLSSQVGNLNNLALLDISDNTLSGEIPSTLGDCITLDTLYMNGNFFHGTIPSFLGQLKSIEEIDLSRNNLSGPIPESLGELRLLNTLNLSFNMLEGQVPSDGVFNNISAFSVLGNKELCGGIIPLDLPACPPDVVVHPKRRKISNRSVIILATTTPIAILLCLAAVCACILVKRSGRQRHSLVSSVGDPFPKISYGELLVSTNGFSTENLIGEGKYGSVYKGVLGSDQQTVAIKVLKLEQHGADKSFLTECEALRNIRHRNLVKIITICSSSDFQRNDFKALVFDFMPNGSLEAWLHPSSNSREQEAKTLNLIQRLNVAVDVASALHYLHHQCEAPIIHCDLKPSNVLLDDDLSAHVGDFGISRFLPAAKGECSDNQSSKSAIRGTVGYVAPEYGMGSEVSTQGDIYSYGILLLEMFTGKRPTNHLFTGNVNLHGYVKMALPDKVTEIVDSRILFENSDSSSDMNNTSIRNSREECLASILEVGVLCSAEMPNERADIKEVLKELHRISSVLVQIVN